MSVYDFQGKILDEIVIDNGRDRDSNLTEGLITIPDSLKLFNFTVKPNPKTEFLILDPYGDENFLPESVRERLFGKETARTIAINLVTGFIYYAALFYDDYHNLVLVLTLVEPNDDGGFLCVPKAYRKNKCKDLVTWLSSCKRPFRWTLPGYTLSDFIDREIGYSDLEQDLELELYAKAGHWLRLGRGKYCTTTTWQSEG